MRGLGIVMLTWSLGGAACSLDLTGLGDGGGATRADGDVRVDASGFDASGFDASGFDASRVDAARFDGGGVDAGGVDAGGVDAGGVDAGGVDASPTDGGGPTDTGSPDAGPPFCDTGDPTLSVCLRFEDDLVDESAAPHPVRGTGHGFATGAVGRALSVDASAAVWLTATGGLSRPPLTVEAWVRPTSIPTSGRRGILDLDDAYGVFTYPGGDVGCSNNMGEVARAAGALSSGSFTHVTCVFLPAEIRIFIDGVGVSRESSGWTGSIGTADLRIGANSPDGDFFEGRIDEVRIFTSARSAREITDAAGR